MGSPGPCQHSPAPNPASAPLSLLPVHDGGGAALRLAPASGDRTPSKPPHAEVLAEEQALPTALSISATAGLQRQSQAGVTPCHSMLPPPWQWQQAPGPAFLSPTASFLPLTAHKRAGGIRTYVTLPAADAQASVMAGSSESRCCTCTCCCGPVTGMWL